MIRRVRFERTLGGILLVAGTTIGAGMLALPVITSFTGFIPSLFIFSAFWLLMLLTAFFFLDVNLAIRGEPNMISMSKRTLGSFGKTVSWVVYLLLLYSLLAAYIAGSAPLFQQAFSFLTNITIPKSIASFILPFTFGSFLWFGTSGVDYLNRALMIGLAIAYVILASTLPSHIDLSLLTKVNFKAGIIAIPIVLTSFGYHIIIPSLTTYLEHDRKALKKVLIVGSLIPFIFYLSWQFLVLGTLPFELLKSTCFQGTSAIAPLAEFTKSPWILFSAGAFSFFAIITSFLGVSLSLSDFLTDGLRIRKTWKGKALAYALTFIPPIIFVFSYQRGFYIALEYAGICVAILLILLPSLMAWKIKDHPFYQSLKGKILLSAVILLAIVLIAVDFFVRYKYYTIITA